MERRQFSGEGTGLLGKLDGTDIVAHLRNAVVIARLGDEDAVAGAKRVKGAQAIDELRQAALALVVDHSHRECRYRNCRVTLSAQRHGAQDPYTVRANDF